MVELDGKRIVITGPTGQVAKPLALTLAKNNDVTAIARFNNATARAELAFFLSCHLPQLAEKAAQPVAGGAETPTSIAR